MIECKKCGGKFGQLSFYRKGRAMHGKFHTCKSCIQKATSSNNYERAIEYLEEMDFVFIMEVWMDTYYASGDLTFGKYLSKMALPEYARQSFKESVFEDKERSYKGKSFYNEEWQGTFSVQDLKFLDKYYENLQRDYKITTTNHKDYARKIAKSSLAMDKAYERMIHDRQDNNAHREFKELKGIFDDLCKSAQFSESTRSATDVGLGSFGVIFNKVEKKCWIPEHKPVKKDTFDLLLAQFANIEKSL